MSAQMRDVRSRMEEDENLRILMSRWAPRVATAARLLRPCLHPLTLPRSCVLATSSCNTTPHLLPTRSLRGSNLSDADFADARVQMRLVSVDEAEDGEALPLVYDPDRIEEVRWLGG